MTTQEVANRLVELCRQGKILEAQEELYGDDIVCVEPAHSPTPVTKGKVAVLEKGRRFASMIEERHGGHFADPVVNGRHFAVPTMIDATMTGRGRMKLEEISVYEVKDGKIVNEQFFY
jgi:SnoaL-like protein